MLGPIKNQLFQVPSEGSHRPSCVRRSSEIRFDSDKQQELNQILATKRSKYINQRQMMMEERNRPDRFEILGVSTRGVKKVETCQSLPIQFKLPKLNENA